MFPRLQQQPVSSVYTPMWSAIAVLAIIKKQPINSGYFFMIPSLEIRQGQRQLRSTIQRLHTAPRRRLDGAFGVVNTGIRSTHDERPSRRLQLGEVAVRVENHRLKIGLLNLTHARTVNGV